MSKRISLFIIVFLFSLFCIIVPTSVLANGIEWKNWESKSNVALDKVWKVKLNHSISLDSIHDQSVYVEDANQQRVRVTPVLDPESNQILVQPPDGGYKPNSMYYLFISSQIKNTNGKALKEPVKMNFRTGTSWESNQTSFEPRPDSVNDAVLQENVSTLNENAVSNLIDIDEENGRLIFSGQPDLTASLKEGEILTLPPSIEFPFGVAKKVESVRSNQNQTTVNTSEPTLAEVVKTLDFSQEISVTANNIAIHEASFISQSVAEIGNENSQLLAQSLQDPITVVNEPNGNVTIRLKEVNVFQAGENTAKLNGSITLEKPRVSADIDFNIFLGGLKSAQVLFTAGQKADLTFILPKTTYEKKFELKLADITVPIPAVPGAGVMVQMFLVQKVDGSIEIDFRTSEHVNVKVGLTYKDGKITPIGDIKSQAGIDVLKIDGEINYDLGLKLGTYLSYLQMKIAGLEATGGYRMHQKGYMGDPVSPCYTMNHQLYATGGYTLNVLNQSGNLLNWQRSLGSYEYCKAISSITAESNSLQLEPGQKQQLKITGIAQDSSTRPLTDNLTFSSSNSNVATVNATGLITVSGSAKEGDQATIGVKYNNKQSTTVSVEIKGKGNPSTQDPSLKSLTIEEGNLNPLFAPENRAYSVEVAPSVDEVTLTATAANDQHSVTVFGNKLTNGKMKVPLATGQSDTVILIEVYNLSSNSYVAYTITVKKQSTDNFIYESEPNNDFMQANLLQENVEMKGHVNDINGMVKDPEDWYKLILPEDGAMTFTSTHLQYGNIYLKDQDNNLIYAPASFGTYRDTYTVNNLKAGTYYIQIITFGAEDYSLKYDFISYENYKKEKEPNNTMHEAGVLSPNEIVSGNIGYTNQGGKRDNFDWYKIEIVDDGDINLHLSKASPYNKTDVITTIYNNEGFVNVNSGVYLKKGTYYIEVSTLDESMPDADYTLFYTFYPDYLK